MPIVVKDGTVQMVNVQVIYVRPQQIVVVIDNVITENVGIRALIRISARIQNTVIYANTVFVFAAPRTSAEPFSFSGIGYSEIGVDNFWNSRWSMSFIMMRTHSLVATIKSSGHCTRRG